jgi:glycosyltransferase involved in cell wall biosynthesis
MNILAFVHLRNIHHSTGAGRVAREMTEHLAQQSGVRLQVLADSGDYKKIVPQVGEPWTGYGYRFFRDETSRQQARWYLLNAPTGEHYWPETEIVYCTAESYVPVDKCRLAVTVHDAQTFDAGAHRLTTALLKQRFKWTLLFRRLAGKADLFHTVSQFSADRLAHHFPEIRSRLRVVHNAVSPHFFEPPAEADRRVLQELGVSGRPYILVPGGLHFRKNADLILGAWPQIHQHLPEVRLVIVGHCDASYLDAARALGPSVVIAGFREENELRALYAAAELVWFPSRYEGFGLPVLEAMACGTPVVTSNTTALAEIGGTAAVLLSPKRASDHVEAIRELITNSRWADQLRSEGRVRAKTFSWQASASLLHGHFVSIL